jgi:hypothetical protein
MESRSFEQRCDGKAAGRCDGAPNVAGGSLRGSAGWNPAASTTVRTRKPRDSSRGLSSILIAGVLALSFLVACGVEPTQAFTFENKTDTPVTVRVNDRLRLHLQPGERKAFNTPNNKGNRHVIVIDERGTTRIDRNYTWSELEAAGFVVLIQ